jgi:hypothetical protein
MRKALVIAVGAFTLMLAPVDAHAATTHRVTISGEIVDRWTAKDPASCGINGSGSVTVSFKTHASTRVVPYISEFGGRPRSSKFGVWVLGVYRTGLTHMGARKADATITTVDDTVRGPNTDDPGTPCAPLDKSDCGTKRFPDAFAEASGYDTRHLYGGFIGEFDHVTDCHLGGLGSWVYPQTVAPGISRNRDFLLKMPSPRTLRRKRVVVVADSDHRTSTSKTSENSTEVLTDDVTRRLTVTLTKV